MKIEIEKPVVPRFVADFIEKNKLFNVRGILSKIDPFEETNVYEWCETVDEEHTYQTLITAILFGYEVEEESLYYAKNKLTGQYLGNKDIGIGSCIPQPYWFFDKDHLQIEKLPKEVFKRVYDLDDTNADFEEVE